MPGYLRDGRLRTRREITAINFLANISLEPRKPSSRQPAAIPYNSSRLSVANSCQHFSQVNSSHKLFSSNSGDALRSSESPVLQTADDNDSDGECEGIVIQLTPRAYKDDVENESTETGHDEFDDGPFPSYFRTPPTSKRPRPPTANHNGADGKSPRKRASLNNILISPEISHSTPHPHPFERQVSAPMPVQRSPRSIRSGTPSAEDSQNVTRRTIFGRQAPIVMSSILGYTRQQRDHYMHKLEQRHGDLSSLQFRYLYGISMTAGGPESPLPDLGNSFAAPGEKEISFGHLIVPSKNTAVTRQENHAHMKLNNIEGECRTYVYDPEVLDSHSFTNVKSIELPLASFKSSTLPYTNPSQAKKQMNENFRERFPYVQITLSKMRSLKKEILRIATEKCFLELWIVAQAYVFFEKLILKSLVNKTNRKLCVGACLLIAAKMNDIKQKQIGEIVQECESALRVSRADLVLCEFNCVVALEFTLHVEEYEIKTHYSRLSSDS